MLPPLAGSRLGAEAEGEGAFGGGSKADALDASRYVQGFFDGVQASFLPLHLFEPARLLRVGQWVLGQQLRSLTSRSLQALVAYFLRFAKRRQRRALNCIVALARQRMGLLVREAAAAEAKAAAARAASQAAAAAAAAAQQERERQRAEYDEYIGVTHYR